MRPFIATVALLLIASTAAAGPTSQLLGKDTPIADTRTYVRDEARHAQTDAIGFVAGHASPNAVLGLAAEGQYRACWTADWASGGHLTDEMQANGCSDAYDPNEPKHQNKFSLSRAIDDAADWFVDTVFRVLPI